VQDAATMRAKVLYPALKALALGEVTVNDAFDGHVNGVFFESLFAAIELSDDDAQLQWQNELEGLAYRELERAIERCAVPAQRRYAAISKAESVFRGCLRKQFPTFAASRERAAVEQSTGILR
jgi:hypothetical protein